MRPNEPSWRADALARSPHTRWADELRAPLADPDPERAATICAAVTRTALRDFAPAVILLAAPERERARALAAYALLLFDFANQTGLEGERLAQINRLEFDLESALGGELAGQPVFVLMARTAPWPEPALDRLAACARARIAEPRPATERSAREEASRLGAALAEALVGARSPGAGRLAAALLRLAGLLALADDLRRGRARLAREVLSDSWTRGSLDRAELEPVIRGEAHAIAELLADVDPSGLSASERRAARYLRLAGRRLAAAVDRLGGRLLDGPPSLGPLTRTVLLARAFLPSRRG